MKLAFWYRNVEDACYYKGKYAKETARLKSICKVLHGKCKTNDIDVDDLNISDIINDGENDGVPDEPIEVPRDEFHRDASYLVKALGMTGC